MKADPEASLKVGTHLGRRYGSGCVYSSVKCHGLFISYPLKTTASSLTVVGPLAETSFWQDRALNLSALSDQLYSDSVRRIVKVIGVICSENCQGDRGELFN